MQTEPQSHPLTAPRSAQEASVAVSIASEWTIVPLSPFRAVLESCGVRVINEHKAQIECPGVALHSSPTAEDSCITRYNGRWLCAYCFRSCCRQAVRELNRKLFRAAGIATPSFGSTPSARYGRDEDVAKQQAWQQKQRECEELKRQAIALFPRIQQECHWPADAIKADSPVAITSVVRHRYYYILDLFEDEDVLWCADEVNRTGQTWHQKHFRRVSRWMGGTRFPGAFTCPNTFKPGVFSRSEANIASRKFLVVESDNVLDRDHVGAVFRWLDKHLKLPLRAVVDTGNKSLHGWFECPSEGLLEKLMTILPAVGCDRAMFKPAQPCRMPGIRREATGRWQELLYLAPSPVGPVNERANSASNDAEIFP